MRSPASPAQKSQLPWPVFVHDDAHGQSDGRQQEGAHSEGQVQHLVLVLADRPAVHLQVLLRIRQCRGGRVGEVEVGAVFWMVRKMKEQRRSDEQTLFFFTQFLLLTLHSAAMLVVPNGNQHKGVL